MVSAGAVSRRLRPVLFLIAVVIVWQLYVDLFKVPTFILPTPWKVGAALAENFWLLMDNTYITMYETILGFVMGAVVAIASAVAIVHSNLLRTTLLPAMVAFQAVPKVAVAPILAVWFGIGLESKIVMSLLIAYFPIVVNTAAGLEFVHPDLLDLVRSMKATQWQIFLKIRLPHSLPLMLEGFKIAMPLAVVGAIIGEFVSAENGLGVVLLISTHLLNMPLFFAALIVVTVISILLYVVVLVMERGLIRWRPSHG